jgi:2-polyprenyl-3-methyl-5-hydroxy-6-metoxy-1,4-benzoquinol methylase
LVNSLSYHHGNKINITGVDFNPIAIEYANQTKNKCKINSNFIISDLNKFTTVENFDLIISLGVLHHTNNCLEALKYICKFGNKNSYLFLGLYHKYGREPFLKHFSDMKDKSEDYKFEEYKKLHKNITDKKKLYSWFRDQVLNVHETQHTFKEISQLLINLEYSIIFTSINKFKKINNLKDIYELEKECFNISLQKLKQKEYYPGFFITIAKK